MNVLKNFNCIDSVEVLRPKDGDIVTVKLKDRDYTNYELEAAVTSICNHIKEIFPNVNVLCFKGVEKISIIRKE